MDMRLRGAFSYELKAFFLPIPFTFHVSPFTVFYAFTIFFDFILPVAFLVSTTRLLCFTMNL
jgi:hypothetical protein